MRVNAAPGSDSVIALIQTLEDSAVVLLDARLEEVSGGQLLAAIHTSGVYRRCAVALIAETISDEWIGWLREGVIDGIVPYTADVDAWRAHLSTMRRGHQLYCELKQLRVASVKEMRQDGITGAFDRESMLTLLFRETDRVQRLHGTLCLVIFAIDDFDRLITELGQNVCDRLLKEVTERTGRLLRSYDMLGRTAPNEFLLALPGCSMVHAEMMAERLRMEVFSEPFAARDLREGGTAEINSMRLTACFGVTASRGRSPLVVLREAEQTLVLSRDLGPGTIRCVSQALFSMDASTGQDPLSAQSEVLV